MRRKNDPETVLITARGCPGQCNFCATRVIGQKYRTHPLDHIFSELEDIQKYGFESFFIGDDTFACNTHRTIQFCDEYIRRNFKMKWTSNIRMVDATSERLESMRKAGAYRVFVGFETFNPDNNGAYNKGDFSFERAKKTVDLISSYGLEVHGSFMIGGPGDTREGLLKSVGLIRKLGLTVATFNKIYSWPGTRFAQETEKNGVFYTEGPFWFEQKSWINRHPFYTKNMSPEEIDQVSKEMYFEFLN